MRTTTITIGFRNPAFKAMTFDVSGMPQNVRDHAEALGLASMIRDAGAGEKGDSDRQKAYRAKYDSMLAGETGGRMPVSPETAMMRIGLALVVKALVAAGAGDAKSLSASYIAMPDPVLAAVNGIATVRGLDDVAMHALLKKVQRAAKAAYDAANGEI